MELQVEDPIFPTAQRQEWTSRGLVRESMTDNGGRGVGRSKNNFKDDGAVSEPLIIFHFCSTFKYLSLAT